MKKTDIQKEKKTDILNDLKKKSRQKNQGQKVERS